MSTEAPPEPPTPNKRRPQWKSLRNQTRRFQLKAKRIRRLEGQIVRARRFWRQMQQAEQAFQQFPSEHKSDLIQKIRAQIERTLKLNTHDTRL